jgi:hypothetical protein
MADTYDYIPPPIDTGSASDYMGQVGGYNIGAQPSFTAPDVSAQVQPQTFAPTTQGYTPTFDFASYLPAAPSYTTFGAGGQAQQTQDPYATFQGGGEYTAPSTQFAGPVSGVSAPQQLQSLYQQSAQPLPSIIGQVGGKTGYAGAQGQDLYGGLYDTTGISDTGTTPAPQDKGNFLQSLLGKGFSTSDALKLALGLGGGLLGMSNQKKADDAAAAAEAEYKAAAQQAASQYQGLAQPYLTAGGSQLAQALQGSLGPAQMQQYQAAQAQLAQGAAKSGGVGSIQSAAALQNMYQQALQNQQNMALQLLGPGNQLASNAISTELQGTQGGLQMGLNLAQQANSASQNMYSAIASMIGGSKPSPTGATA